MAEGAVVAKCRAVSANFLTKNDYLDLIHKSSVGAAVGLLKTKPLYSRVFADTSESTIHRDRAEALISKCAFEHYLRVCKYASPGKKSITSFFSKQLEAAQLSGAVSAVMSGSQERYLNAFPQYLQKYIDLDPIALAGAKDLYGLAAVISGTPYYKPLLPLLTSDEPDINHIITTINCCYLKWVFSAIDECAKGKERELLRSFFLRKIDADNLMICYRMKSSFAADTHELSELLVPYHHRLKPAEIENALKAPDAVSALRELFTAKRLASEERFTFAPEIGVNEQDYRYFRHRLALTVSETEAVYSLMMLFSVQTSNLYRVIEGIRYGLAPEETEKYLIV